MIAGRVFSLQRACRQSHSAAAPALVHTARDAVARAAQCNAFTEHRPTNGACFAVKDNIHVAGFRTTCASSLLLGAPTQVRSAPVVDAIVRHSASILAAASAALQSPLYRHMADGNYSECGDSTHSANDASMTLSICGKTNMDAFGIGGASTHSAHGAVRHPADARRTAGGSSGGSAAAVASGAALFALGSDTGGSVRAPAARTGLVGVRAGRGGVPRDGLVAYAPSLDALGVLAPSVSLAAAVYSAMRAARGFDALCASGYGDPDATAGASSDAVRVAVIEDAPVDDAILMRIAQACSRVVYTRVSKWKGALQAYTVISAVEAASSLARFLVPGCVGSRPLEPEALGPAAAAKVRLGRALARDAPERVASARAYACALEAALESAVFAHADVLALPALSHTGAPPRVDDVVLRTESDWNAVLGGAVPRDLGDDALAVPASLAGLPALTVPLPGLRVLDDGAAWPVSVQLVCPRGREAAMFSVAESLRPSAHLEA